MLPGYCLGSGEGGPWKARDASWGRATEPAPRWRALLDRALLGGRTGEQHEVRAAPRTAPEQPAGNGYQARASAPVAYPQDLPYAPAPEFAPPPETYPTAPSQPGYGQPWQDEPGWDGEPAWEAAETRYSPVSTDNGYASGTHIEWQETAPDAEVQRAIGVLRRDMGGPRVLAFANPKGGVHKTTATVLAAATVGSVRGRGVLAWDDNELRGTLGLRAGSARHARTIRHLIADLAEVEAQHGLDLHRPAGRLPAARLRRRRTTCWPARRTRGSPSGSTSTRCAGCSSCCAAPTT